MLLGRDQPQQIANCSMGFNRVSQRLALANAITVLSAHAFSLDKAAFLQVLNDPLHSSFRNPNTSGHLSQNNLRIGIQPGQHVGVIG